MKFPDVVRQVDPICGFSHLRPSCINFPFLFAVPVRQVSASWFPKQSFGIVHKRRICCIPSLHTSPVVTVLVSQGGSRGSRNGFIGPKGLVGGVFGFLQDCTSDPREVLSRLEELVPEKGLGFTNAVRKKAFLRGAVKSKSTECSSFGRKYW